MHNKRLEEYLEKCKNGQEEIVEALKAAEDAVLRLKRQEAVVYGQIMAIEQLMDAPPITEIPIVDEEMIEEAHDKRLNLFDGVTPEEFLEDRKEVVYKREAMDFVDTIDAINNEPE